MQCVVPEVLAGVHCCALLLSQQFDIGLSLSHRGSLYSCVLQLKPKKRVGAGCVRVVEKERGVFVSTRSLDLQDSAVTMRWNTCTSSLSKYTHV